MTFFLSCPELVEASAGAGFGEVVAVDFAFAEFLGVVGGVVVALLLFGGGEDSLFGAADALVSVHTFEEEPRLR